MIAASLALMLAAASASDGEKAFQRCYACHAVNPGEKNLQGPNLAGVVGRRAAALPGFGYSPAMQAAARELVWTEDALDRFLADPEAVVPGTEMSMPPLRNARDRQTIIAYLRAHGRAK